jgi:hypothetical protein
MVEFLGERIKVLMAEFLSFCWKEVHRDLKILVLRGGIYDTDLPIKSLCLKSFLRSLYLRI